MQSPSHPESTNSTPRSKAGSWTEETAISTVTTTVTKIRLMCSYGGQIAPRPHDKTLCYLNGDTRMVAVDKNNISLADLVAKIARSLPSTHPRPFVLKYQLPSEDLDSLISVTTDEDLENMIEEHDRIAEVSGNGLKPRRIRIFIFSERKKVGEEPEEENWFVEGLNNGGIVHNSTDSHGSSVNYLLGLEEDDRGLNHHHSNNNNNNHSSCSSVVTESVAMTTMPTLRTSTLQVDAFSSFESSASSPSSNLPPIKVRVDDNQNQRSGLDEGFAQMGIYSEQKPDENFGGNLFDHQNHLQSSQNPIMSAVSLPTKFTDNITVSESFPKTYSSADQKSPLPPIQPPEPLHQERCVDIYSFDFFHKYFQNIVFYLQFYYLSSCNFSLILELLKSPPPSKTMTITHTPLHQIQITDSIKYCRIKPTVCNPTTIMNSSIFKSPR